MNRENWYRGYTLKIGYVAIIEEGIMEERVWLLGAIGNWHAF